MNKLISIFTGIFLLIIGVSICLPNLFAATGQTVTILTDESYPPYSFVDNGQLKGIYIEIVNEAAKLLAPHYKVEIVAHPWKRALHEIKKGTVLAILPPYKHLEKRSYIWPYSVPLMKENIVAFCQKGVNLFEHIKPQTIKNNGPLIIGINAGYLILNQHLEQAQKNKTHYY